MEDMEDYRDRIRRAQEYITGKLFDMMAAQRPWLHHYDTAMIRAMMAGDTVLAGNLRGEYEVGAWSDWDDEAWWNEAGL